MERRRGKRRCFGQVKVDGNEGMRRYPRALPGSTLLIDRHYNSLNPYRKGEQNMYAVRKDGGCTIKYVEVAGSTNILRPPNQAYPISALPVEEDKTYAD